MTSAPARSSRFQVPRHRDSLLVRSHLLNRLHESVGNGLIVVQAPAGYGKSTLLGDFATEVAANYTVCWLSLDPSCSVPEVLATELAMALLGEDDFVPPAAVGRTGDLKAYLGAILSEAVKNSELPLLLIFDNVQDLGAEDDATIDLMDWLVESSPQGTEIILAGRDLPAIGAVDWRIAGGEAVVLGSADLAFSESEVGTLCERSGHQAPELWQATGGWPVAVMAICSGTIAYGSSKKKPQDAAWARYLGAQVLAAVPEHLQEALLRLAPLPVMDSWQAEERIGRTAWVELAAWLRAHDFLYEALDGGRFRLNPMVRTFLCDEYQRREPAAFDSTLGDLIETLAHEGRTSEAIELARHDGQERRLADVLEDSAQELLHRGAFAQLWRGFESMPASLLETRPVLAGVRTRVLVHLGRPQDALEEADRLLGDPSFTGAARVHAVLAKMRALRLFGKRDEVVEMSNRVRAIEDCGGNSAVLAELAYAEADVALSVTADLPRAERMLRETINLCDDAGLQALGLLASSTLGQTLTMKGNAPAAVDILVRAASGWRRIGRSANLGWVLNNLGMAYLQVGDFESAVTVLTEAREEGERCKNPRNAAYAIASMGDAELALGHWDRARELYEDAIRICAEEAPDETLAALSICGLAGALLGLGDLQQADYFIQRAVLVATASSNSFEMATCRLQQAAVESASGDHATAVAMASEAVELFTAMDTQTSLCAAYYRLAMCQFKAGHRQDSQETLQTLKDLLTDPWMVGALVPLLREQPMFAQWVASRSLAGRAFREFIERQPFPGEEDTGEEEAVPASRFPAVVAKSLGPCSVSVGGREVTEEGWSSLRAKELFFLFLANPSGLRKEEAVGHLFPELAPAKCNSAFHSNLYRLRKAIYQESVIKRDGGYVLNPDGTFTWDVEQFEGALAEAQVLPAGSEERAAAYKNALTLYQGPFAEAFYSEWAETVRRRTADRSHQALSTLAGYYAGRGQFGEAANCMERLLAGDHLNEEAAYQLATYRTRGGQTTLALAFIDDYRRLYSDEYGEDVPERFVHLRAQIAAGGHG